METQESSYVPQNTLRRKTMRKRVSDFFTNGKASHLFLGFTFLPPNQLEPPVFGFLQTLKYSGCQLISPVEIHRGNTITIHLKSLPGNFFEKEFLLATVLHCKRLRSKSNSWFELDTAFEDMSQQTQENIENYVSFLLEN